MCVRIISQQETDRTSRPSNIIYYTVLFLYTRYIIFYMTSNIVRNQRLKKVSKDRLTIQLQNIDIIIMIYTLTAQTQMRCPALKSLTATQRCTKRNLQKVFFIVSFFLLLLILLLRYRLCAINF